ncbi:hypothetical protein ACIRSU_12890 [Streptomyces sp. NPDC101160]|uniref:hypothetical protein n=1 Tax=Streptomyces sp. NPDC101160 TaxID=3366118 RepID=UPI0037F6B174
MDDLAVRLKDLLFPSVADVVVLSLDVHVAIVRIRRHGRRTERLRSTLPDIGPAPAGRAGARLARVLGGVGVSRCTVLRLVEALSETEPAALRAFGVDEYATRKGRRYGTVLKDVAACRPSAGPGSGQPRSLAGEAAGD